jgi:hypothetical protein
MGVYALQMLILPRSIHEVHFNTPVTEDLVFWIRGTSCSVLAAIAAIMNLPEDMAHKVLLSRCDLIRWCKKKRSPGLLSSANELTRSDNIQIVSTHQVALGWIAAVGVLYPWNTKLGYLSKMDVKYPMHYLPEVLMLVLTAMGAMALAK